MTPTAVYRQDRLPRGYFVGPTGLHVESIVLYDEQGEWFQTNGLLEIWNAENYDGGPHVREIFIGPARSTEEPDLTMGDAFVLPTQADYMLIAGSHDLYLPAPRVEPTEHKIETSAVEISYLHVFHDVELTCTDSNGRRLEKIDLEASAPHRREPTGLGRRVEEFWSKVEPHASDRGRTLSKYSAAELLRAYDVTFTLRKPA